MLVAIRLFSVKCATASGKSARRCRHSSSPSSDPEFVLPVSRQPLDGRANEPFPLAPERDALTAGPPRIDAPAQRGILAPADRRAAWPTAAAHGNAHSTASSGEINAARAKQRVPRKATQKGQECLTLGEVVRANAAKLTAKIRLPKTICETPRESMIRVRVRNSLSLDRLRDKDAGLSDRPLGNALTGIVMTSYTFTTLLEMLFRV
ncbi:hypothetical protein SKAU_G00308340 [Synaphobranchus kaupii]|uniref:Uncharacterized protein n=1 Tax=Synaphobranchus kaupii TaxID=118154 RepID=A0A9Q1ER71_SYNKA|nr:hypothetical protein SKAU_G00308340 [Synaphobranchus kaupii]